MLRSFTAPPLARAPKPKPRAAARSRKPTSVQSLLFGRDAGWTAGKAKSWAKSHGYRYGKVDVTDQYIRIRQLDPKGLKVKRTVPFGKGIRAVVAREVREERMARASTAKEAPRRRRRRTGKKKARAAAPKRRRRRVRASAAVAAPKRRRRRRAVKVQAVRRRRRRRSHVMEAPRRRRKRRTRARASVRAWRGNAPGHAKAARKGWRKRKHRRASPRRRKRARETVAYEAPRRRRRRHTRRRARESAVAEAPRRSRRRYHRRHRGMFESRGTGMAAAEITMALLAGGVGYVLADGVDRLLSTYDPSAAERPKDKFTSDGAGTLGNTLNVASRPGLLRIAAGVGMAAVPATGAVFVKNPLVRASLEGMAVGAGVSLFKTLWNTLLMPLLVGKDTSVPALQKSWIARLYPAEVAASINLAQQPPQQAVSSSGSGALSGADVGPFALAAESPYPDAAQALRQQAGVQEQHPSMENIWGTGGDSPYPSAAQALRQQAGMSAPAGHGYPAQPGMGYEPGPPAEGGPGPKADPHTDPSCGCVGDPLAGYSSFLGDAPAEEPLSIG